MRLVIVPGAGHLRSWNISPEAYERRLTEFLAEFPRRPDRLCS